MIPVTGSLDAVNADQEDMDDIVNMRALQVSMEHTVQINAHVKMVEHVTL